MKFVKGYLQSCAKLHATLAGHHSSDQTLAKIHQDHADYLSSLVSELDNVDGGGDVSTGKPFTAFSEADTLKRFLGVRPDGVRGVGLTEEQTRMESVDLTSLKLVGRPGQTVGAETGGAVRTPEDEWMRKFVEVS